MYQGEERRKYFRVRDVVGLDFHALGPEEVKAHNQRKHETGYFAYTSNFDNRIHTLLDAVRVQNPAAAEVLDLINKKINFLTSRLDTEGDLVRPVGLETRPVSLSACGISFHVGEYLSVGSMVHLDMVLKPEELHLSSLARVVECNEHDLESPGAEYYLRLEFEGINPTDEELLIQHVMRRQNELIKALRQGLEKPD